MTRRSEETIAMTTRATVGTNGNGHRKVSKVPTKARAKRDDTIVPAARRTAAPPNTAAPGRPTMMNAMGTAVPITEWDRLSADSRMEIDHMIEVLKAVKQGDFSVRFEYQKNGVL